MTVLGFQISHKDFDTVCEIKANQLYLKAKIHDLQIYQYHDWIAREIQDQYIKQLYSITEASTEADEWKEYTMQSSRKEKKGFFRKMAHNMMTSFKRQTNESEEEGSAEEVIERYLELDNE